MINLTTKEIEFLTKLNKEYLISGVFNCDLYNVFGLENNSNRGLLSSLMKKGVVDRNTISTNCFNPIFPTKLYKEVQRQLNLETNDDIKTYTEAVEVSNDEKKEFLTRLLNSMQFQYDNYEMSKKERRIALLEIEDVKKSLEELN